MVEHADADRGAQSGRGVHPIMRWSDKANEAARLAIAQDATDLGGVVYQTDTQAYWMADGAGGWSRFFRPSFSVVGMVAKTNTNGEAGTWATITDDLISGTGSTAALLPGTVAESTFYVGGDSLPIGFAIDVSTAMVLGAGAVAVELWNGAAWVAVRTMSAAADLSAQYAGAIFERTGREQVRAGDVSASVAKLLDGETKHWLRVRVTTAITTAPIAESSALQLDGVHLTDDGAEWFGSARPLFMLSAPAHQGWSKDKDNGGKNANMPWGSTVNQEGRNNDFQNGGLSALVYSGTVPIGLDTSKNLSLVVTWMQEDAGNGNVELEVAVIRHEIGDLVDGTATPYETLSQIVAVPGTVAQSTTTEFSIDGSPLLPGDILVVQVFRDATGGNADDTYGGNVEVLANVDLKGSAWKLAAA